MIKKLFIGIAVSTVFIYLALKGVDLKEVLGELRNKSYGFLLPVAAVFILTQIIRSIRWGVILSPIKAINQRSLFPISSVGFMAIIVAPMRLGEIVRPYLINVKHSVPFGSGIRDDSHRKIHGPFDVACVFSSIILSQSFPSRLDCQWRMGPSRASSLLNSCSSLFMIFPERVKKIISPVTKRLPIKIAKGFEASIENIANGFRVISSVKKFRPDLFFIFYRLASLGVGQSICFFSFTSCRLGSWRHLRLPL